MASKSKVRFFLGANSASGFYSLYDQLIDPTQAEDIFILKGGAGCGKSSLMRRVGDTLEDAGLEVAYIQCSGDPTSLDAIVIPKLRAAIVDGTAPHVVEAKFAGVVERYVNLGACYDRGGLGDVREEIMSCMGGYQDCYTRAYRCLNAAAQIGEDMRALLLTPTVEEKMAKRARGILSREVRKLAGVQGHATQRFLGALTWQGAVCLFDTADVLCNRVYELCDSYGLAHGMLTQLASQMMAAGYDVIACPAPLNPGRMEHLLVPALSLAFVTSTPTLPYPNQPYRRIRLDAMVDADLLRRSKPRLRFSKKVSAALIEEGVVSLAQAKEMHDKLEALYNPYVDFDGVYATADAIAEELLSRG